MLPAIFTDHVLTVLTVLTVLGSVLQHSLQLPRCSSTRQNDNTTNNSRTGDDLEQRPGKVRQLSHLI